MVELQLSLSQERDTRAKRRRSGSPKSRKSKSPDPGAYLQHDGIVHKFCPHYREGGPPSEVQQDNPDLQWPGLRVIQGNEAAGHGAAPRGDLRLLLTGRRRKGAGFRQQGVDSPVRRAVRSTSLLFLVSFAVSSEGSRRRSTSERDHSRPHKHRARHGRSPCPGSTAGQLEGAWELRGLLLVPPASSGFFFLRFFLCLSLAFFF